MKVDVRKVPLRLFGACCLSGVLVASLLFSCGDNEEASGQAQAEKVIREGAREEGALAKFAKDVPIYQYYQKIPKISGVTNDPINLIFNLQFELGYDVGDIKTLEKLSKSNIKIAGEIRSNLATRTKIYLGNLNNYNEIENNILELVNKIIAPDPKDKARAKDVIITELFLYDYR